MDSTVDPYPAAWQPLTPSGVAAFARARVSRLLLVQLAVALLTCGTFVWFASTCWYPVITAAIEGLPDQGEIRSGQLKWMGESPQVLAESRFLAIAVDVAHRGQTHSPAQVEVEFGQTDLRVYSVFGYLEIAYAKNYGMGFNVQELKPWWGAWAPILLAIAVGALLLGLISTWMILGTLYCLPTWLIGLYLNRHLTIWGSWRLAGAALMPGALTLTAALAVYGLAKLDLVHLLAAWVFHIVLGWVYLFLGAAAAPRIDLEAGNKVNPFQPAIQPAAPIAPDASQKPSKNPFRPSGD